MSYLPASTKNSMISGGFVPGTTYYWGLVKSTWTPSSSGPGSNEVTGTSSHKRQGSTVSTPATGAEHTTSAMTWTNLPSCTLKYFATNLAATGTGAYKGGGPLTSTITVPSGGTVAAAIGAFTLSCQG